MSMNPVIHDGHAPALAHGHGHGGVGAHGHHGHGHHHEFPAAGDFDFPGGNATAAATAAAAAAAAAYHSDPSLFHHFSHAASAASATYPTSGSNGSAAGGKKRIGGEDRPFRLAARFPPASRLFCDRFSGDLAFSQSENGEKDAAKISGRSASIAASREEERRGANFRLFNISYHLRRVKSSSAPLRIMVIHGACGMDVAAVGEGEGTWNPGTKA